MCIKIKRNALELFLQASRNLYPREFICLLRGNKDIIEEIVMLPLSTYGNGFSSIRWDLVPLNMDIIGTAHSHPGNSYKPSRADLNLFPRIGKIHLIAKYPYKSKNDVAAFDSYGRMMDLEIID